MNVNTDYVSALRLINIEILDASFRKKSEMSPDIELDLKIRRNIEQISETEYVIDLICVIKDINEDLVVSVTTRAKFETEQENIELIQKNAIAIMFPYVRSYVSTITTQPGIAPIVLPPMNIVAMLNSEK